MERVHLQLGIEQTRAVSDELDFANRIRMGQFGEIANLASQGEITIRDDRAPDGYRKATNEEVERIGDACTALGRLFGHSPSSHFGIGAKGLSLKSKRGYEVKKALDKVVADHCSPGGMTVHHDGIIVRYTQDEAPVARLEG